MDKQRFDELTRAFAGRRSRRDVLRTALGGMGAGLVGLATGAGASAKGARQSSDKGPVACGDSEGQECSDGFTCVAGFCLDDDGPTLAVGASCSDDAQCIDSRCFNGHCRSFVGVGEDFDPLGEDFNPLGENFNPLGEDFDPLAEAPTIGVGASCSDDAQCIDSRCFNGHCRAFVGVGEDFNPLAGAPTLCGQGLSLTVCGSDEFCCNESCGICAPIGGSCTQEFCGED